VGAVTGRRCRRPTRRRPLGNSLRSRSRALRVRDAAFVGEPFELAVPATGVVEVVVTRRSRRASRNARPVLPIDWARPAVDKVDVSARQSDARCALLALRRARCRARRRGEAHATYSGRTICTDFDLTLLVSSGEGPVRLTSPFRYGAPEGGYVLASDARPDARRGRHPSA
jgi:hypothetical protein